MVGRGSGLRVLALGRGSAALGRLTLRSPTLPASIRSPLCVQGLPRFVITRSLQSPIPQCRAPTGTFACRERRAQKAGTTASRKQMTQGTAETTFAFSGVP